MEYDNNNRGAAWINKTATPENRQPSFQGKLIVDNKEYQISMWKVPAQDGKKARLDLKIQEPMRKEEVNAKANDSTSVASGDIPF